MKHTLQSYALESLKKALKHRGMTQVDLATKLQFNKQRVHNYLTGKSEFTLNIFESFCLALGIQADKVFENYAEEKESDSILEDINTEPDAIQSGIVERYQAERKALNALVERLEIENRKLQRGIADRDIEIEKLKSIKN